MSKIKNYKYQLNDKPPFVEGFTLGLQHVLVMMAGNIAVPLVVAGALSLAIGDTAFLVQCAIFTSGVTTIIQSYGIGPVGSRLPIVMGISFVFIAPCIAIGSQWGLSTFFGAAIVCGIIEGFFGAIIVNKIKRFFPPVVVGSIVTMIGLVLVGVGITYSAGGFGAPDFGAMKNYSIALLTFIIILVINQFAKGFLKAASVLIGIIIGNVFASFMGMVDFSQVAQASWFSIPQPLKYGVDFNLSAIGIMLIIYFASMMEYIGDTTGCAMVSVGREPTSKELSGGILCDGLGSAFSGLFNALPNVSFSNNIGLIGITGVASRYVVAMGGAILTVLGLCPKVAMAVSLISYPVLGGAAIIMFGLVVTAGLKLIFLDPLNERNILIIAISISIGLGFNATPNALINYPYYIQALLTGIPGTAVIGVILNLVLPKKENDKKIVKEDNMEIE